MHDEHTEHDSGWEHYVNTMAHHKVMEWLEKFAKIEHIPTCEEIQTWKNIKKGLYYEACVEQSKK